MNGYTCYLKKTAPIIKAGAILFCLLLGLPLWSQSFDSYVRNVVTFNRLMPQEKVYMQFDNTGYYLGDTIWFKAWVVQADNLAPTTLSHVLYVDLVAPEGYCVSTQKFKIENGEARGQIVLEDSVGGGYWEVRGYTRYMLDFGTIQHETYLPPMKFVASGDGLDTQRVTVRKYVQKKVRFLTEEQEKRANIEYVTPFSRVFPVYDRPIEKGKFVPYITRRSVLNTRPKRAIAKKQSEDSTLTVHFFPEGGTRISSLPCNIAFEAARKNGEQVAIRGGLVDSTGDTVDFHSNFEGRGVLLCNPGATRIWVFFEGRDYTFDLPQGEKQGATLTVMRGDSAFSVMMAAGDSLRGDSLGLMVMCRGKALFYTQPSFDADGHARCEVPVRELSTGINQLTLFNRAGAIVAERLFFVNRHDRDGLSLTISPSDSILKSYMPLTLDCRLKDAAGVPMQGKFALSVRDKSTQMETGNSGSILTELLLSGDLKGYIAHPEYYFEKEDSAHLSDLDLLLLVQGWRRYDWKTMAGVTPFQPLYSIEKKLSIEGEVRTPWERNTDPDTNEDLFTISGGKLLPNTKIQVGLVSGRLACDTTVTSNNEGKFLLSVEDEYGMGTFFIKSAKAWDKKLTYQMNETPVSTYYIPLIYPYFGVPRQYSFYETHMPRPVVKKGNMENGSDSLGNENDYAFGTQHLKEFVVKQRRSIFRHIDYTRPAIKFDPRDEGNLCYDLGLQPEPWPEYSYRMRLSGLNCKIAYTNYFTELEVDKNGREHIVLKKNGKPISIDKCQEVRVYSDFDFRARYLQDYTTESEVAEHWYSFSDGKTYIPGFNGRRLNFPLFTAPAQFYSPDYSRMPQPKAGKDDYRRTLYWNPDVETDSEGHAVVKLYNNTHCKEISIDAQGITPEGVPFATQKE